MDEKVRELVTALEELYAEGVPAPSERENPNHPSIYMAARKRLGIAESTVRRRVQKAQADGFILPWEREFTAPVLESPDMSSDDLVDHVTRRFEQRRRASEQRKWIPLKFHKTGPLAVSFLGDPHVDDNGCNWTRLREDLHTINQTEGMYAASLGDASNNWVGRLSRLWASQETSGRQSWQLVQWLLQATDWCLLVKGNHDLWLPNDADPIEWLKVPGTLSQDWQARIELQFPKGRNAKVWAAHDMPGHSQWKPLHAQQKRAKFTQEADLYISGHRHTWALAQYEDEWTNVIYLSLIHI